MTGVASQTIRHRAATFAFAVGVAATVGACSSTVLDERTDLDSVSIGASEDDVLLAHLYAQALHTAGSEVRVEVLDEDRLAALDEGTVTLVPGYTGRMLGQVDPGATVTDADDVFRALARALPGELTVSDHAAAQDRAVLVAPTGLLDEWGVDSVADLVPRCAELTLLAAEGFVEAGGTEDLAAVGCEPVTVRVDDVTNVEIPPGTIVGGTSASPTLLDLSEDAGLRAVRDAPDRNPDREESEAASESPVFVAQNVVPVFLRAALDDRRLDALRTVAGELTTADLAEMRARVDDGEDPEQVAREWVAGRA